MYYFTYGSNMKTKRLEKRVGKAVVMGKATLKDYCLKFNKLGKDRSGKANIESKENSLVEGTLFNLTEEQFKRLNTYEGVPTHYFRSKMNVIESNDNTVVAEVYIANPNKVQGNLRPKCEYLQHLIDGADEYSLNDQYKQFLASFECVK